MNRRFDSSWARRRGKPKIHDEEGRSSWLPAFPHARCIPVNLIYRLLPGDGEEHHAPPTKESNMPRPQRLHIVVVLLLLACAAPLSAQDAKPVFSSASGFVVASGKWKSTSGIPGDEMPEKHAVEIQCRLDIRECYEATARIVAGQPQVVLLNYSVIEWDKNGIIAEDSSSICMTNRLLISFQEQGVMAVDTPKKGAKGMPLGDGKNACQLVNHTQTYKLVASWK